MPTWTYDTALLTARDRVRFFVGDTIEALAYVYDDEIAGMLAITPDELLCAAEICEAQAAQASQLVDYSIGGSSAIKTQLSQRAQAFAMRAKTLRQRSFTKTAMPIYGKPPQGQTIHDVDIFHVLEGT